MAYKKETDTYTCDFCGFENGWEDYDEHHGELWGCEKCGKTFCTQCFMDKFGGKEYMNMMQNATEVHCPECWEKHREVVHSE